MKDTKNIYQSLIEFQSKMIEIQIKENGYNPHYKSKYPTLKDIIEAIRLPLIECGLGYTQSVKNEGVETIIFNVNGETIVSLVPLNMAVTPQAMGSAITYARRYGITSALNLVTEKDDDGAIASTPAPTKEVAKPTFLDNVNSLITQITDSEKAEKARKWFEQRTDQEKTIINKTKFFVKISEFEEK